MSSPGTIKWDNKSNNRDYNLYTEEFFGGSDAFIYIDGKRDNSIAHIQFAVQEQHKPIYGYGSRTFDDLAVGTRIVIGAMRIPVRNTDETSDFKWSPSFRKDETAPHIKVPDWVYGYTPDVSSNEPSSENEVGERVSVVSKVQEALGLQPTGFVDGKTKKAIHQFRKTNEMIMDIMIDNELLSKLEVDSNKYKSARKAWMYTDPNLEEGMKVIEEDVGLTIIAKGNRSILIRTDDGITGYIDEGAVSST